MNDTPTREEDFEVPDQVEEVLEQTFEALKDKVTLLLAPLDHT
jgi:hypothetical protein